MLSDRYYDNFLSSCYFVTMLESRLAAIITNRYHCDLDEEQLRLVRIVLKVSPSAAAFVLYGDTSRFDKLADQLITHNLTQDARTMVSALAAERLSQDALIRYANDIAEGRTLQQVDGEAIVGQVLRIGVSTATKDGLAFRLLAVLPIILARVDGDVAKGQLVFGPPEHPLREGTILLMLEENEWALAAFDKALLNDLSNDARKTALNDKGVALGRMADLAAAIACFEEALQIDPDFKDARENLERARQVKVEGNR